MALTRNSSRAVGCIVLLSVFAASVPAALGYRTVGELMEVADVVVHGKVASIEESVTPPKPGPAVRLSAPAAVTAEIVPYEIFKGDSSGNLRVTAVEGMEDSPQFIEGQEVILFLQHGSDGESLTTVGLLQGKLDVADGVVTRTSTPLPAFLDQLRALASN